MSSVVTMSGEIKFTGDVGPRGLRGEQGDKGDKPVKGVDYYTAEDKAEIVNDVTGTSITEYNQNVTEKTAEFDAHVASEKNAATDDITEVGQNIKADFNANATQKTNDFNTNATNKTTDFNTNATNKTGSFDSNASSKTTNFNDNASSKTTAFDNNASSKTGSFNDNASSKKSDFNTNATNKTNVFNQNATDKTTAFNNNYAEKVALFNEETSQYVQRLEAVEEEQTTQNTGIAENRADIDLIESNFNTATAKGDTIDLTDSLNGKTKNQVVYGQASQVTTTGKQLFNKNDYLSIAGYFNSTSNYVITADENNLCVYIPCSANTAYTVSKIASARFGVGYTDVVPAAGVTVQGAILNHSATSITITTGASATYLVAYIRNANQSGEISLTDILNSLMIEDGSTASAYEPYTGEQPSPSPDYPQTIKIATGDVDVVACAKNLYNVFYDSYATGGTKPTVSADGAMTSTSNYAMARGKPQIVPLLKANQTYTVSFNIDELKATGGTPKCTLQFLIFNATTRTYPTGRNNIVINSYTDLGAKSFNLTVPTLLDGEVVVFSFSGGFDSNATSVSGTISNMMIRPASDTDNTFQPYKEFKLTLPLGNIELANIIKGTDDYADKIYEQDGKWYLYKVIQKRELKGTENWSVYTGKTSTFILYNPSIAGICDYYRNIGAGNFDIKPGCYMNNTASVLISDPRYTSLDDFKAFLVSNNVTILYIAGYPSITPTTTEITDTTLLAQLNNLKKNLETYKNTTHVIITASDIAPKIGFDYYVDDRVAQANEIALLKARVDLLEE